MERLPTGQVERLVMIACVLGSSVARVAVRGDRKSCRAVRLETRNGDMFLYPKSHPPRIPDSRKHKLIRISTSLIRVSAPTTSLMQLSTMKRG